MDEDKNLRLLNRWWYWRQKRKNVWKSASSKKEKLKFEYYKNCLEATQWEWNKLSRQNKIDIVYFVTKENIKNL